MQVVRDRIVQTVQAHHASYFKAYLNERCLQQPNENLDAVELSLYVCKRLQGDNDWLVDKLAQVEQQRIADEKLFRSTMEDGQPPH